jgi:hypothetical protein
MKDQGFPTPTPSRPGRPYSYTVMRVSHRLVLAACAAVVLAACLGVSWYLLPGPKGCVGSGAFVPSGPFAPSHCDPGAVNVFGAGVFTLLQTLVMAVGIGTAALLWSRAIMPLLRGTSLGVGIGALALVVAITLPSPVVGAAPSVPCTTPGPNGAVLGACATSPAPTDSRTADRGLVLIAGAVTVALGVWRDSRSLAVVS